MQQQHQCVLLKWKNQRSGGVSGCADIWLGAFKNNCSCLDSNWKTQMNNVCTSLGDCGEKTNYFGVKGYAFDFVTTQTIGS